MVVNTGYSAYKALEQLRQDLEFNLAAFFLYILIIYFDDGKNSHFHDFDFKLI